MKSILILAAVYGTLVGGVLKPAPKMCVENGAWTGTAFLTEAEANAHGWKLVEDVRPAVGSNEYAVAVGWSEDTRIRRVYEVREAERGVRRYSKLKLIVAAKASGKWERVKSFVKSADLEDEFLACQYFEDGNALFVAGTNAVVSSGVATQAEVKALLDASIDDEL